MLISDSVTTMLTISFVCCNSFALCRWLSHTKTEIHPRLLIKLHFNLLECIALHTWINKFCVHKTVCVLVRALYTRPDSHP